MIFIYGGSQCKVYLKVYETNINYLSNSNVTELFDLRFDTLNMNIMEESAGSAFSIAGFTVFLTRVSKSHLSNTYLPSGVLTFISFVGFLIPVDMIPGRMSLLVTIFLMLVNISQMANHRGPVVSKIK